ARSNVHRAADVADALRSGDFPVGQISLLGDLKAAKDRNVQMTAASHQVRVGLIEKRSARNDRYGDFHRVHQVVILLAGLGAPPHPQDSIFTVEVYVDALGQIIGDEIRNAPAEIHVSAVTQFPGGALSDLLTAETRLIRHNAILSPARCDARRWRE